MTTPARLRPPRPLRASATLVLLAAVTACQSDAAPRVSAIDAATGTAQFKCGPTDDLELTLVVASPTAGDEAAGTLTATLGSERWSALARGERRLDFLPGDSARWCIRDGACESPGRLVFAFDQVDLQDGGMLAGSVEIRIEQRSIALPLRSRVERKAPRCG